MRVKEAEYVKDYKIKISFSDDVTKVVDFKPFLKNAKNLLAPLLDIQYFKNFSVDDTTICWPNEVDFCPDVLYDAGQEVKNSSAKQKSVRRHRKNKSSNDAALPSSKRETSSNFKTRD